MVAFSWNGLADGPKDPSWLGVASAHWQTSEMTISKNKSRWIQLAFPLLFLVLLNACASHRVTESNFKNRHPAQSSTVPPFGHTFDSWVFSWTRNPGALKNPQAYVASQLSYAKDCLGKFVGHPDDVKDCEGNNMAAGPGVYTCDNPFTSHDYGTNVVAIKIIGGKTSVGIATGPFAAPPASPGLDREIYANPAFDGILYDFRPMDFGGRALVLRGDHIVDVQQSYALVPFPEQPKKFSAHASYVCTGSTTIPEVLSSWGDQMEFMALAFNNYHDPAGQSFIENGKLNSAGIAAAIASDVVAMPDSALKIVLIGLKKKFAVVKESMDEVSCRSTDSGTDRSCLAVRIFDSLIEDQGTPNRPTFAWKLDILKKVLVALKDVAPPAQITSAKTAPDLIKNLFKNFSKQNHSMERALEAYGCMVGAKHQLEPGNFSHWGDDPQ